MYMIIILGVMKILNKDTQSEESFNLIKKCTTLTMVAHPEK